jgi:hypothetical protein
MWRRCDVLGVPPGFRGIQVREPQSYVIVQENTRHHIVVALETTLERLCLFKRRALFSSSDL